MSCPSEEFTGNPISCLARKPCWSFQRDGAPVRQYKNLNSTSGGSLNWSQRRDTSEKRWLKIWMPFEDNEVFQMTAFIWTDKCFPTFSYTGSQSWPLSFSKTALASVIKWYEITDAFASQSHLMSSCIEVEMHRDIVKWRLRSRLRTSWGSWCDH